LTQPVSLKDRIISGPPIFGFSLGSLSPSVVEVAGMCGLDFVWIEGEHGSADVMHVEHLCRAAELRGLIPMLRVPEGSRAWVLRGLEAGAKIIVIPQVNTVEQAAAIAEYGKFPPIGKRGFNFGSRGLRYGFDGAVASEVFARANASTVLLPQIESAQAVRNAEAILSIEGIDGVLVGPGDLSVDMGLVGQNENEELVSAAESVFLLANKLGKIAATVCSTEAVTKRWLEAGVHMLNIGGDLGAVRSFFSSRLEYFREITNKH